MATVDIRPEVRTSTGQPRVEQLLARSHPNEVAVANKLARTAWAVAAYERTWQADWQGKAAV